MKKTILTILLTIAIAVFMAGVLILVSEFPNQSIYVIGGFGVALIVYIIYLISSAIINDFF